MILKTLSTKYTAKYFEDKYNIKLKRQYRIDYKKVLRTAQNALLQI